MDKIEYMKKWRKANAEKLALDKKTFYLKNKVRMNARNYELKKEQYKTCPWLKTLLSIRNRLNPKRTYASLGVKNLLSAEDLKFMWHRDKAYEMKKPSIDRVDGFGHYVLSNCRYIELKENLNRPKCYRKTSW